MKCPICEIEPKMTERTGIEIDYCEKCRGVWLDRGKLDKIIERSTSSLQSIEYTGRNSRQRGFPDSDRHYKKKKHKSLLNELFDF
jgi:Zn-finger nucleic acid-binding protein